MNPMQYAVYKGTGGRFGAIQFNFQPPHFYFGREAKDFTGVVDKDNSNSRAAFTVNEGRVVLKDGWKAREGAIFVEIAPTIDKNTYDWKQKIIFALSVGDMGQLLYFLATGRSPREKERTRADGNPSYSMTIMHDPNAKTKRQGEVQKYLRIFSPKGTAEGCMLSVTSIDKTKDLKLEHQLPLTGDEIIALRTLLQAAISRALNW